MDGFLGGHSYQMLLSWEVACGVSVPVYFDFTGWPVEAGDPAVTITQLPRALATRRRVVDPRHDRS